VVLNKVAANPFTPQTVFTTRLKHRIFNSGVKTVGTNEKS